MPSPVFISRPPPGFSVLSVIRGVQLTFLGAIRALKNPYLIESGYYRRAFKAVIISLIIQFLLWFPLGILKIFVRFLSLFALSNDSAAMFSNMLDTLSFIQNNVLNIGPFFVTAFRYFLPEMDEMFLMSLKFVDQVYKKKHPNSHREYYSPLALRPSIEKNKRSISTPPKASVTSEPAKKVGTDKPPQNLLEQVIYYATNLGHFVSNASGFANDVRKNKPFQAFVLRYLTRTGISMGLYLLSFLPIVGGLVFPAMSFYTFNNVVGTPTAVAIFGVGYYLPRRWMVKFLGTFWGGRSLVRELLAPYFNRLPYTKPDRERWFRAREGIMFGFGAVFYLFIKTPFIGVVAYGVAEASTAYLITKVTEPPPPPPGVPLHSSSPAASGFTSLAKTGFVANTQPSTSSGPSLRPSSATSAETASKVEELLVGSHASEETWMQRDLAWTNSDKFLSGVSLDTDGFGDAPDIVPGAWASSSAAQTATNLRQDAAQNMYKDPVFTGTDAPLSK